MYNHILFTSSKELEHCQGLKARRPLHEAPTIKTISLTHPLSRNYNNVTAKVNPEKIDNNLDPEANSTDPAICILTVVN